ncbi:MAG: 5'/3'-nucleotidase SurE [Natrialbaceae archaeon]|nr:5'/3'-nucleotidase SurE [Natrialbaceae archaeon]
MGADLEILLTNDDGIDSVGLRAMYEGLSSVGNVTTVAPADDQSAVGRSLSTVVDVDEHELGYALHGTPADCVVAGLAELGPFPDLVVSGCNRGANLGEYVLGRSGTISAAVEAAFFDVPAIATSMYVSVSEGSFANADPDPDHYREAVRATTYLAERAIEAGVFDPAAYLNINAPMVADGEQCGLELTRPSRRYEMDATHDGEQIHLQDRIWETMDPESLPDPPGTDRRAVVEGRISVSPLTAPHAIHHPAALERLIEDYPADSGPA